MASISQNVIDEAVGQWRKRLRASLRQKDITQLYSPFEKAAQLYPKNDFDHLLN